MKKYFLTLTLIFLFSLLLKEEKTLSVMSYKDNEYSMYILSFPNKNVSTNNLEQLFNDIQIIWVKPYINELYKEKINYKNYYFESNLLKSNINKFTKDYIKVLMDNNYRTDAIRYQVSGIKILEMQVYANEDKINNLKIENINIKKVE